MVFHHLRLTFVVSTLLLSFESFKLLILLVVINALVLNLVFKLSNLEILLLTDVFSLIILILLHLFDFSLQMLNFIFDLDALALRNENNLRILNSWQVLVFFLILFLLNSEDADRTITRTTEKCCVIIGNSHLLDW